MSGDILDAIDGAIDDWETSPDAMRWTPEPEVQWPSQGEWTLDPEPPVAHWTLVETPIDVPWTTLTLSREVTFRDLPVILHGVAVLHGVATDRHAFLRLGGGVL